MEGSEKRLILAIALCIVIWMIFAPKESSPQKAEQSTAEKTAEISKADTNLSTNFAPVAHSAQVSTNDVEKRVTLENKDVSYEVSNNAGQFTHIILKRYKKELHTNEKVDLILKDNFHDFFPKVELEVNKQKVDSDFINGPYSLTQPTPHEIVLTKTFNKLFVIEKRLNLPASGFLIDNAYVIKNISPSSLLVNLRLVIPSEIHEEKKSSFFQPRSDESYGATIYTNDTYSHTVFKNLKPSEEKSFAGNISWIGIDSKYFLTAFVPRVSKFESLFIRRNEDKEVQTVIRYVDTVVEKNTQGNYSFSLYTGPKEINLLKNVAPNLEKSIDLGSWLGPLARPLLLLLKLIYTYVRNYGIAIIILTLLARLLLYPISLKQFKSMKAMQRLGPELAALKKKYKDDKQRINIETMNLFKRNKVNPMGGCLPMLLQMPIFFALYRVLYNSIELRHAPFFLWIQDLSAPDPYYISPVLMAIAMFFQQKFTPSATTDPAQAKIMKIMPIIFSLFMIALPSGLVLYILVSSLASMPQQIYMMRSNK